MIKSGNISNFFLIIIIIFSVKYGTVPFRNPKSKYCCYIAQPSMLSHNYVQFWHINYGLCQEETQFATSQAALSVAYTLTVLALNAREVTQFPQLILPANMHSFELNMQVKKYILLCIDFKKGIDVYGQLHLCNECAFFANVLLLNHHPFGEVEVGCDQMIH